MLQPKTKLDRLAYRGQESQEVIESHLGMRIGNGRIVWGCHLGLGFYKSRIPPESWEEGMKALMVSSSSPFPQDGCRGITTPAGQLQHCSLACNSTSARPQQNSKCWSPIAGCDATPCSDSGN